MTTSHVFCPTNSPKKTKISSFTVRRDEEKQQIITFQKLNQTMNDSVLLKLSTDLRHVKSIRRKRENETSQPIRTTCAAVFKIEMWPGERAWLEETPVRYEIYLSLPLEPNRLHRLLSQHLFFIGGFFQLTSFVSSFLSACLSVLDSQSDSLQFWSQN